MLAPGTRVQVEIADVDLLSLELRMQYRATLAAAAQ
jgi:hypothetical protein